MPNHIHKILIIDPNNWVDARPAPTIGDVICSFKSNFVNDNIKRIAKHNLNEIGKIWQRNYYEHIIRNDSKLEKIRQYVQDNPYNWGKDKDNPKNI